MKNFEATNNKSNKKQQESFSFKQTKEGMKVKLFNLDDLPYLADAIWHLIDINKKAVEVSYKSIQITITTEMSISDIKTIFIEKFLNSEKYKIPWKH